MVIQQGECFFEACIVLLFPFYAGLVGAIIPASIENEHEKEAFAIKNAAIITYVIKNSCFSHRNA